MRTDAELLALARNGAVTFERATERAAYFRSKGGPTFSRMADECERMAKLIEGPDAAPSKVEILQMAARVQGAQYESLRQRVAALEILAERVARLNPDAGEIGAGMLASLVEQARNLTNWSSST